MKYFSLPAFFLGAFLLAIGAQAQTPPPSAPGRTGKEPEGISLRIVSTNLFGDIKLPDWAIIDAAGGVAPLPLVPWNISPPILIQKSDSIRIYDPVALKAVLDSKKSLPTPLLNVPIPAGANKCLLVLRPSKDGKNWETQVYDDSDKQYPGGSRIFLNLTPFHISGSAGSANFDIPPQGSALVDPQIRSGDFRAPVTVYALLPTRKATVLDEQWAFFPKSRGIALIFEAQDAIRLIGIPDELPPEPTTPPKSKIN